VIARAIILAGLIWGIYAAPAQAGPTLDHIRAQGQLTCGVNPGVAGFSIAGTDGRWRGFDTDICRAIAAALFGTAAKVRFVGIESVEQFQASEEVDIALRGLTWTFGREPGRGLRFGPIVYYDGQQILVPKRLGIVRLRDLAGRRICVQKGAPLASLARAFKRRRLALEAVLFADADAALGAFFAGRCAAVASDGFELAAAQLGRAKDPLAYRILPERLTDEPLAPLLRRGDEDFFDVVRWAIFALIDAETLGLSTRTLGEMEKSADPDVKAFLNPAEAPGFAPGWSRAVLREIGNYGEIFQRNLGRPSGFSRGPNAPAAKGGWLTAPPLR
jgi:general L-amino acid transport system substrate-binding protein